MAKKIAVVAANGRVGQLVVKEAVERGLDVTAIVREENKTEAQNALVKDALDLTAENTLAGEELTLNAAGESTVSYADYAIAIVDLIESGEHVCERVAVVSK